MLRPRRRKNRYMGADDSYYPPFRSIAELDDMVLFLTDLKEDWKAEQEKSKKDFPPKKDTKLSVSQAIFAVMFFGPMVTGIEFLLLYHFVFKAFMK